MGAGPGEIGPDGEVLAGVFLAALDAFFEIEIFLLERLEEGGGGEGGEGGRVEVEEVETGVEAGGFGADVEPDEAFGGTADGDAELVDGEAAGEGFDIGGGVARGLLDAFELFAGVDDADGVEVETLDFGGGEGVGDEGLGFVEGYDGEAFAGGEIGEEGGEIRAGGGGAVEELIGGVVFDGGPALTGGSIAFFEVGVEIPDAVDEFGDLLGAAEVGAELVDGRGGEFVVEDVVEPGPFEICGADGLGFVAGDEDGDGAAAEFGEAFGETGDEEGLDGGEVLAFVDGDAVPGEVFVGELLDGEPGEVEIGEEASGDGAAGFFEASGGGVGGFGGLAAEVDGAAFDVFSVVLALDAGGGETAEAGGEGAADDVGVELVVEGGVVLRPGSEGAGERGGFDAEAGALLGEGNGGRVDTDEIAEETGEGGDVVVAGVGAVAIEEGAGEGGEIGAVGEVEDVGGAGLIGGVEEGGGFARAGVTFEDADGVTGGGEFGLLGGPGGGAVVFTADFGDGDGEIVVGEGVGGEGRVVVVVADIAEEEGTLGGVETFDGDGALGGPPGVEVGAGGAAEAGAAPAFVVALRAFEMEAFGVDEQALEEEGGAFTDGLRSVGFQSFEEVWMAEERTGVARRLKEIVHRDTVSSMKLLWVVVCMAGVVWADEAITALGRTWRVPLAADWRGTEGVLDLLVKRPQEKPRRPKQFALLEEGPYSAVTIEVEVKRNETSLILVYAYQDDAHFNYVHLSVDDPAKVAAHNGVFHVFGGDRVRISPLEGGAGALPDSDWTKVKLVWDGKEVVCWVNGKTTGALRGVDLSLRKGRIGLGSFFETASFRNLRVSGRLL